MHARIEKLVRLQTIDIDRSRISTELNALPAEAARAQSDLAKAQSDAAAAADALAREESLRNRLEREIAGHRQKAARFKTQLDVVKTAEQASAIEHEVSFSESEASRLEDEEFASLERTEAQEGILAKARAEIERLAEALEKVKQRGDERKRQYQADLSVLQKERDELRKEIEADLLARYDRLAAARGTAVARAENQQCSGCRMGIRLQTWNQLREGELLACDSCARMLYWDPAFFAVPKSPHAAADSESTTSKSARL